MAIKLDDHHKQDLKQNHNLQRKRFEKTLERIEREILIEKDFLDLENREDWSVDDLEEMLEAHPDWLERLRYIKQKVKRLVVQEDFKLQEEYKKQFLRDYKREFLPDGLWPTQWMLNGVKIMHNLELKKNSLFFPLMNYLCDSRLEPERSRKVTRTIGAGGHHVDGKMRDYIILKRPNRKKIADHLGTSDVTVHRYLKEMVHQGILKDLGKYDSNKPKVYAIGYYSPFVMGMKPIWFLKESPKMKQALREFDTMRRVSSCQISIQI